jgi:hypothetical protein
MLIGFGLTAVSSWSLYPRIQMQLLGCCPSLAVTQLQMVAPTTAAIAASLHSCTARAQGQDTAWLHGKE